MHLEKLIISAYEKAGKEGTGDSKVEDFVTQINPATLAVGKRINRNKDETSQGRQEVSSLGSVAADTLSFELLFDSTGVVKDTQGEDVEYVQERIQELEALIYDFQSESHQSNFVEIKWGKHFLFRGYLTSIQINYTLFDSNGDALRAKVNLSFEGFIPPAKFEKDKSFASPDMSHVKFPNQSDTLAMYCKEIYGDSKYVIQIAEYNQLVNFRKLQVGQRLEFPPLINVDYV
jgi:hypothetical protein